MKLLINIDVPALAPAIHFYTEALGLEFTRQLDDDVAELSGTSCKLYLLRNSQASPAIPRMSINRDYARHWTPIHLDFVVDNLNEAAQRALAAGAQQENACVEWRGSRCITFSDPFGHGFCLIEFDAHSYLEDDGLHPNG